MKSYRCKQCRDKWEEGTQIRDWIASFCSKSCRLEFQRVKVRKEKEKVKVRKVKAKTKKANSISVLKKKLWTTVSLFIRLRDSDDDNFCTCVTCWDYRHYKDSIQSWHYIASGQSSHHRYNPKNIHPQCYWCNVGKWGNVLEYQKFMIKKYWQEYTDWLFDTRNDITDLWSEEIKQLTVYYADMLYDLKLNKAID